MPSSFYTVQNDPVREELPLSNITEDVIEDAPVLHGGWNKLNAQGRTLKSTLHPMLLQGQAWISEMGSRPAFSFVV
jgi:hypothetical protein